MSNSRSGATVRSGGRGDHLQVVPFRPHRSRAVQVLLFVWRWLFELLFLAACVAVVVRLHSHGLPVVWAITAVVAALAFPFLIPRTRRVLMAVVWTAITRHRLRAYFVECRVFNRSGKLPWIVAARPTAVGERVWVWLVPGLSIHDFENDTEQIASACWARTTRVERHRRIAALVRLDVVRRDPLTSGGVLPSTLVPAGTRRENRQDTSTGPLDLPRPVVDLTAPTFATNGKATDSRATTRKGKTSTGASTGKDTPVPASSASPGRESDPVVTRGGEDVSDYV
jgi:hypothetical protein